MIDTYIICGTPRSGSTLLCDLLTETGIAGRPASYFRPQSISNWAERFGLAENPGGPNFDRAYLDAVLRAGRDGTSIFGLRLMWENAGDLLARLRRIYPQTDGDLALLEQAFGRTAFLHLSRTDKVAQAVSLVRALQSGLWHLAADGTERERSAPHREPAYDASVIGRQVDELEAHDAAWTKWFAEHAITPTRLSYEELSARPTEALAGILAAIGLDSTAAATIAPRTAKMSDTRSAEWVVRFRASPPEARSS